MERAQANVHKILFLGDADCFTPMIESTTTTVRQAYSAAEKEEAFRAAIVEWRKRNPAATLDAARVAVANIISTKA
jgi:hypothetical protein